MSAPADHPPANDRPTPDRTTNNQLVDGYLLSAARAFAPLPPEHAAELLADLRDHIAAERAALDAETEADIRGILDRLGDPQLISAEARRGTGQVSAPPIPALPAYRDVHPPAPKSSKTWLWVAVVAVAALCALGTVLGVGLFTAAEQGPIADVPGAPPSAPSPASSAPTATPS